MEFFDCNCKIGFEREPYFVFSETADELIEEMDVYGIKKALVYHTYAKNYYPEKGNMILSDMVNKYPERLYSVYVFIPNTNMHFFKPSRFVDELCRKRVKGVLFSPVAGKYEIHINMFKDILSMLNEMKMPIFIEYEGMSLYSYLPNYKELEELLSNYKNIPIVIFNSGFWFDIELYSLASRYKNIYLEISGYQSNFSIENFCREFKSSNLLYGSRYPLFSPGASKFKVENLHLDLKDKEKIAYGNMQRLCEEIYYYE